MFKSKDPQKLLRKDKKRNTKYKNMARNYSKTVVIIPARMGSSRLPNKPLANINGKTLIQRVYENVEKYTNFPVWIAAGEQKIVDSVKAFGGNAILTDPNHPSGSDRVEEALRKIDPKGTKYRRVVNFQGDSVNVDPKIITDLVELSLKTHCDLTTPCMIMKEKDYNDPGCVKLVAPFAKGINAARCLYFTRAKAPHDREVQDSLYHHIGIYVFKAKSLRKFVKSKEGFLEKREKLEQLRVLELGMSIYAKLIKKLTLNDKAPADIDTPEELEEARKTIKD